MQFVALKVGGLGQDFAPNSTQVVDFSFPSPALTASAMLQGFQLARREGDIGLRNIGIELFTHFAAGQSAGSVEVRFRLLGSEGAIFPTDLFQAEINVLVVGT